jgi:8-oxo-dGTP pyrophosphatase MutT (NUDIX family)
MLSLWLPPCKSLLPAFPHTQVGVGAFVVTRGRREVLAVKERFGSEALRSLWKLPTGLVDRGEDLSTAILRELKEETGLSDTHVLRVLNMRHMHGLPFGKSDMFFCLLVECRNPTLPKLYDDPNHEIAACAWLSFEALLAQPAFDDSEARRDQHGPLALPEMLRQCVRAADAWLQDPTTFSSHIPNDSMNRTNAPFGEGQENLLAPHNTSPLLLVDPATQPNDKLASAQLFANLEHEIVDPLNTTISTSISSESSIITSSNNPDFQLPGLDSKFNSDTGQLNTNPNGSSSCSSLNNSICISDNIQGRTHSDRVGKRKGFDSASLRVSMKGANSHMLYY